MVRSITSQPASFSRLRACDGEISWSTSKASIGTGETASAASSLPATSVESLYRGFCGARSVSSTSSVDSPRT